MKKYRVCLIGWDFDTSEIIEASSAAKAKGVFIKNNIKGFLEGYPKKMFFQCLRSKKIRTT